MFLLKKKEAMIYENPIFFHKLVTRDSKKKFRHKKKVLKVLFFVLFKFFHKK